MTLKEGANGETITLQASAPPYVLCRDKVNASDECQIQIQVKKSDFFMLLLRTDCVPFVFVICVCAYVCVCFVLFCFLLHFFLC